MYAVECPVFVKQALSFVHQYRPLIEAWKSGPQFIGEKPSEIALDVVRLRSESESAEYWFAQLSLQSRYKQYVKILDVLWHSLCSRDWALQEIATFVEKHGEADLSLKLVDQLESLKSLCCGNNDCCVARFEQLTTFLEDICKGHGWEFEKRPKLREYACEDSLVQYVTYVTRLFDMIRLSPLGDGDYSHDAMEVAMEWWNQLVGLHSWLEYRRDEFMKSAKTQRARNELNEICRAVGLIGKHFTLPTCDDDWNPSSGPYLNGELEAFDCSKIERASKTALKLRVRLKVENVQKPKSDPATDIPDSHRDAGLKSGEPLTATYIRKRYGIVPSQLSKKLSSSHRLKAGRAYVYRYADIKRLCEGR